jgi:hypothetical protein
MFVGGNMSANATTVRVGPPVDSLSDVVWPRIAATTAGEFVIVGGTPYGNSDGQVIARLFDAMGSPIGNQFQVDWTDHEILSANVAADSAGNFVVVWTDCTYGCEGLGQRYDSAGVPVGGQFQLGTPSAGAIAMQPNGDFVLVWGALLGDNARGIFGKRFSSTGAAVGSAFQVNTFTTGPQVNGRVVADGDGDFLVLWSGLPEEPVEPLVMEVFGQLYSSNGAPVGSNFQVSTNGAGWFAEPAAAVNSNGDFMVTWGSVGRLMGRRLDNAGVPLSGEFQVNTYTGAVAVGSFNDVVADSDDGFFVAWKRGGDASAIVLQRYDGAGNRQGTEFPVIFEAKPNRPRVAVVAPNTIEVAHKDKVQRLFTCVPACGPCENCDPDLGCVEGPRDSCAEPTVPFKARVLLQNKENDNADKLLFRWSKGDMTWVFGDPLNEDSFTTCVYEGPAASPSLVMSTTAPAGGLCSGGGSVDRPCWDETVVSGVPRHKYKDREGTPEGITQIKLTPGTTGKAKVRVRGKGPNLGMPPLGLELPVTVQLHATNGRCWSATVFEAGVSKNQPDRFKGRAGSASGAFLESGSSLVD